MTDGLSVDLHHRQGTFTLAAAFAAPSGVTALFGRSGSGKTTIVGAIAGLVRPDRGRITVDGTILLDTARGIRLPPHRRRIGFVFQDSRLLPHLSVRQNLLFGRWFAPRGAAGPDLATVIDLLGIGDLLGRRPAALSGGERQRVAIGRALLARPRLLLMDEPLASLDEGRKDEILPFLERLRDEARLPIVYVSHVVAEVVRLADTVVRVEAGKVVAYGPAAEVLSGFDAVGEPGAGAVLDATVAAHDPVHRVTTLSTQAGDLYVSLTEDAPGARRRVLIRPRDVTLSLDAPGRVSAPNLLAGTVTDISEAGPLAFVRLTCNGAPIVAEVTRTAFARLGLAPGMHVHAMVTSVTLAAGRGARRGA